VSQNAGNNQVNRAMKAYPIALMFSGIVAVITIAYSFLFRDFIIGMLVNSESSKEYIQIVIDLFRWEIFSKLTSAIVAITLGMFYGFRLTKVTLLMNIARLFVFRIPALWLLSRYTDLGHHSIGVAMFVSNTSTAILAVIMAVVFFKKVKNNGYGNFLVS
jgi:Na+-driven multidrug efflux pump